VTRAQRADPLARGRFSAAKPATGNSCCESMSGPAGESQPHSHVRQNVCNKACHRPSMIPSQTGAIVVGPTCDQTV
jgi:hypothetical protein